MLYGIDVSHQQSAMKFDDFDFVMIKATEGIGYYDDKCDMHYNNLHNSTDGKPDKYKLYGFYHYARPDLNNSPEEEAEWFLSKVGHHAGYAMYALDWEGYSLNYPVDWALRWLQYVFEHTGMRPLFYIQSSAVMTGKYKKIYDKNFGLWLAHYADVPKYKDWPFYAMWQYQGSPLDKNQFNGDANTWRSYVDPDGTHRENSFQNSDESKTFHKGEFVKVTSRVDYNGVTNASWVLNQTFTVMEEPKGDRVVIGHSGAITGAWKAKDLRKV